MKTSLALSLVEMENQILLFTNAQFSGPVTKSYVVPYLSCPCSMGDYLFPFLFSISFHLKSSLSIFVLEPFTKTPSESEKQVWEENCFNCHTPAAAAAADLFY